MLQSLAGFMIYYTKERFNVDQTLIFQLRFTLRKKFTTTLAAILFLPEEIKETENQKLSDYSKTIGNETKLINVIERDQHNSTFNKGLTWTQKRRLGMVIERLQISRLRKYSPMANKDLFIYSTQIWVNLPNLNASLPTHNQLLETRNYFFRSLNR